MTKPNNIRKLRSVGKWVLWILLFQFVLINISGALYAYKLTHFYQPTAASARRPSPNVFLKTWKLFRGPRLEKITNEDPPRVPFEIVHLQTKDKISLEGWYLPLDSSKGTVVMVHGLGRNKSLDLDQAYEFRDLGFNVLLFDLRAHGKSEGKASTMGYYESEDVKTAFDYISQKGEKNIILYGISLGSVAVAKAAYDYGITPSKIILEIPFNSFRKMVGMRGKLIGFPQEPFGSFVTFWISIENGFNGFNQYTSNYVRKINCPVLMQSGAWDIFASMKEINSIFANISSADKKLVIYENAGHQVLLKVDPVRWRQEVSNFVLK